MENNVNEEVLQEQETPEEVKELKNDEVPEEGKKFDPTKIADLVDVVNHNNIRHDIEDRKQSIDEARSELLQGLAGSEDKTFLSRNLDKFESKDDLIKFLSHCSEEDVDKLFTNPDTGEKLEVTLEMSDKKIKEFRRDLLIYFKTSDDTNKALDEEYDKLELDTKEFQDNIAIASKTLSDETLMLASYYESTAEKTDDPALKKKLLKSVESIRSGFDFTAIKESYQKHPTAIPKCISLLTSEKDLVSVGQRYMNKLKSNKIRVSLFPYVSDLEKRKSFEEMVLAPDEYIHKDLFAVSMIRYFSMSDMHDPHIRQSHAIVIHNMGKMLKNDFPDDVKAEVRQSIIDYLKIFE